MRSAPDGLEFVEQTVDVAHGVDPSAHDPLAASLVLGDEVGPFEHGDVLLHGGEAHRVAPSQVGDGVLAVQHQPDDVAPRRIGERVEQQIRPLRLPDSNLIYNHMVVRYLNVQNLANIGSTMPAVVVLRPVSSDDDVISAHLAKLPQPQRDTLSALRVTLRELLPEADECLSYDMPCFKVGGKAVAGFDGFKRHCSYFPHSGSIVEHVGGIPDWCTAATKGTLQFPVDRPLPKALVRRLVRARLDEIATKAASSRRR